MFAGSFATQRADSKPRIIPPPTPVHFPKVEPQSTGQRPQHSTPLVAHLQTVYRPADIKASHFEALNIHVTSDASPTDIIPWSGYLPLSEEWNAIPQDQLVQENEASRKPLNNGNLSPGVQTYRERQKELLSDNTAAFRTVRRIPPPAGETAARLGNAYEFFKNLELFSGFWPDTSLPLASQEDGEEAGSSRPEEHQIAPSTSPPSTRHIQTHVAIGNGAQLPPDYRTHLLHAFTKLVAYDFGCNVTFARSEPRLHLTPGATVDPSSKEKLHPRTQPPSHFNSSATFLYRIPTDRASARNGTVEGPLAVLSARASHTFTLPSDHNLDFAREIVAILLTAQQRARHDKTERRFGEGEWWTTVPRWGGGLGGPIGKESEAKFELLKAAEEGIASGKGVANAVNMEARRLIGGINPPKAASPSPNKRSKTSLTVGGNMQMYENYRSLTPPASTWDRKCRYEAIGKVAGEDFDDIFLISCLNHHVSIVRARVPDKLINVLEGGAEDEGWGKLELWRSKWFDLYQGKERVEAMDIVWGMMAWLMRKVEVNEQGDRMDAS